MKSPAVLDRAYRDLLSDIKEKAQLSNATIQSVNAGTLLKAVSDTESSYGTGGGSHAPTTRFLGSGFAGIATPLDQLIRELKEALAVAQRNEVIKQPNTDEAPPAYRSAVSDYFETMSKKYRPDSGDTDTNKP